MKSFFLSFFLSFLFLFCHICQIGNYKYVPKKRERKKKKKKKKKKFTDSLNFSIQQNKLTSSYFSIELDRYLLLFKMDLKRNNLSKKVTTFSFSFLSSLGINIEEKYHSDFQKVISQLELSFSSIILSFKYIEQFTQSQRYQNQNHHDENCCCSVCLLSLDIQRNPFSLVIVSLLSACKYLHDSSYSNQVWSTVSGIQLNILNQIEILFLTSLGFNLYISEGAYSQWLLYLIEFISNQQLLQMNSLLLHSNQQSQQQQLQLQQQQQHLGTRKLSNLGSPSISAKRKYTEIQEPSYQNYCSFVSTSSSTEALSFPSTSQPLRSSMSNKRRAVFV